MKDCQVRAGLNTDTWKKALRLGKVQEQQVTFFLNEFITSYEIISKDDLAFSILHSRGRKSLDLLANNTEIRNSWVNGLERVIHDNVGKPHTNITDKYNNNLKHGYNSNNFIFRWLEGLFNEADRNRNGLLCPREVHRLLEKLNVRLTTDEFEQCFEVKKS